MKILVIDNAAIVRKEKEHYTNVLNGLFLSELRDLGHDITCIQFSFEWTHGISTFCLEKNKINCIILPSWKNKIIRYLTSVPKLVKAIEKSEFIYFYYPNSFRWGTYICRFCRKPYGLYIRGMNGIQDKLSLRIYKNAYNVLTVSDAFTAMVNTSVGKRIAYTIRPMIPYSDEDVVKDRIYKSKDKFKILYLGRIAKDKGLAELILASSELHNRGFKFDLHLVGNGEFIDYLKIMSEKLGLSSFVFFDGPIYDDKAKAACYQESDIYVLPTYHEGFPRTLYEAMIFGTPIITTFVGGIPALMKDGENSKRIEPRSTDSIVEGLSYAMDHYPEMGKMAKNASGLVARIVNRNRLTHAQHLNQILNEYDK